MTEFETAFNQYQKSMYNSIRRMGVPHSKAQDAVQEAANRLSQMSTISYLEPARVKGLFCQVAVNCAKSIMTKEKNQNNTEKLYEEAYEHQKISSREKETHISIAVHRALSRLSELDSYIAWHYWALGMSLREVSEDLERNKNIKWDHVRLSRHIRKTIKPMLKEALLKSFIDETTKLP